MKKAWEWIESLLMFMGFIYVIMIIIVFFVFMIPILILFERSDKRVEES